MATDEATAVEALEKADEMRRNLAAGAGSTRERLQWVLLYHLGKALIYALFHLGDCVQDLTSEVRSAGGRL
jgi:hypothetical protein